MTDVETPTITEYYKGIPLSLEQLESAIWMLAAVLEEYDADATARLIENAKQSLLHGASEMSAFASTMISTQLHGSTSELRAELNREYNSRGYVQHRWEYNPFMGPIYPFMERVNLSAYEIGKNQYILQIRDRTGHGYTETNWLEIDISKALEVERVLTSITIKFSLGTNTDRTRYVYDIAPFIDTLLTLGIAPEQGTTSDPLSFENVADHWTSTVNRSNDYLSDDLRFLSTTPEGVQIRIGTLGCQYAHHKVHLKPRVVDVTIDGTVFSGPIAVATWKGDGSLMEPELYITLERPAPKDGAPNWREWSSDTLKAPARQLCAGIARIDT